MLLVLYDFNIHVLFFQFRNHTFSGSDLAFSEAIHGCTVQVCLCYRELQHTVSSIQKNVQMLKSEVSRYKTRAHKAEEKLNKLAVSSVYRTCL